MSRRPFSAIMLAAGFALLLAGCAFERVRIQPGHDEGDASGVVQSRSFALHGPGGDVFASGMELTLESTLPAPKVDGRQVQATDVAFAANGTLYVSFNTEGEAHRGALQLVSLKKPSKPKVDYEALFSSTDLNRLQTRDDQIYVAGADDALLATLDLFRFDPKQGLVHQTVTDMSSYQTTTLDLAGDRAYVTTGNTGGLSVLNLDLSGQKAPAILNFMPLQDARYVERFDGGKPVDIIFVVDQSGSMSGEIAMVRKHMNTFAARISDANVDYHVVLVAARTHDPDHHEICIPEPLAGKKCADGPRFEQIDQHVDSHDALKQIKKHISAIESFLRPQSVRHIVVVSDDQSNLSARNFDGFLSTRAGWQGYTFHSVVGYKKGGCAPNKGSHYLDLSHQSHGLTFDICKADWAVLFDTLATSVATEGEVLLVTGHPGRVLRQTIPAPGGAWPAPVAEAKLQGASVGAPTWGKAVGNLFFVSADRAGVVVFSVDSSGIKQVKVLPTKGTANGLAVTQDKRLAFLANGEEGLVVMDVQCATKARVLATFDVPGDSGSANAVALSGNLAALADGLGGVKIFSYRLKK